MASWRDAAAVPLSVADHARDLLMLKSQLFNSFAPPHRVRPLAEGMTAAGLGGSLRDLRDMLPSPVSMREQDAARLCALRPPYGLASEGVMRKSATMLREGLSLAERSAWSGNSTTELCALFHERLARVTVPRPPARYRSCALVGSGGILSRSGSGAAIDAHEAVLRFNGAPLEGFVRDVGNRTTVWVVAGQHLLGPHTVRPGELVALYCSNAWLGACHFGLLLPKRRAGNHPIMLLNPMLVQDTADLPAAGNATRMPGSLRTRPSAGLMGVSLAAKLCDSVTLYGFGNDSHPNNSNACRHYYDCKFSQKRYFSGKLGFHNWHHQWRVLSRWVGSGARPWSCPRSSPMHARASDGHD